MDRESHGRHITDGTSMSGQVREAKPIQIRVESSSSATTPPSATDGKKSKSSSHTCLLHRIPKVFRRHLGVPTWKKKTIHQPSGTSMSLGELLSLQCPSEILPHILSFAGPQTVAALGRVSRRWKALIDDESTWHVLCEELYKWKAGDPIPVSWKEYYFRNPCVPVDFSTISRALAVARVPETNRNENANSDLPPTMRPLCPVRIWLRPGVHELSKPIHIHRSVRSAPIILERMETPMYQKEAVSPSSKIRTPSTTTRTTAMTALPTTAPKQLNQDNSLDGGGTAHTVSTVSTYGYDDDDDDDYDVSEDDYDDDDDDDDDDDADATTQGAVILRMSRQWKGNQPLFRVSHGGLELRNIRLHHFSLGNDIWGGNAAIHVEALSPRSRRRSRRGERVAVVPPMMANTNNAVENHNPLVQQQQQQPPQPEKCRAWVHVKNCEITSESGRGIAVLEGGRLEMNDCHVHHCAATGVYLQGKASSAQPHRIRSSDIVSNGRGSRGLVCGHSGLCLENSGAVEILDTNIASNDGCGITVVDPQHCHVTLEHSDLVSNRFMPLCLPTLESNDSDGNHRLWSLIRQNQESHHHVLQDNRLISHGDIRPRTALYQNSSSKKAIVNTSSSR